MYEEDLNQLYSWVVENGLEAAPAQTVIAFLANSSSNYPALALLRTSLNSQTSEFISYQVYSGLTEMIADSHYHSKAEDRGIKQTNQSIT